MSHLSRIFLLGVYLLGATGMAKPVEYLIKFSKAPHSRSLSFLNNCGGKIDVVSEEGDLYKWSSDQDVPVCLDDSIEYVQPNYTLHLLTNPSLAANRAAFAKEALNHPEWNRSMATDNPEIENPVKQQTSTDPLVKDAWGMGKVGASNNWTAKHTGEGIIVAVTDTGVDYNHEDLINNMWRNPGEIPGDGIDNDKNGFIDDVVGWDFAANDNKPFDMTSSLLEIILMGGNPGHGTHVSGVVAAKYNNGMGTSGVAPSAKIMALRFITEKGQGETAGAIKAIDYAAANGANIINASWGGEKGDEDDTALSEAIERAGKKGVIFVAAAGNGRADQAKGTSAGFDNDTDPKPMIPASLPLDNIVTVAATDSNDDLAGFSNWGQKTVDIGAPGVKILSTVPGNEYQDTVIDLGPLHATWDGTSMASPFVSGGLAVAWSAHPTYDAKDIIHLVLSNATPVAALKTKVSSGGRLSLSAVVQ